jgi:hypothetical protein
MEENIMKITIFALAFFTLTLPAFGQGVDPLLGTWKFNPEKSTSTAPLAKSAVNTYTKDGENIAFNMEAIDAQGKPFKVSFQQIYDGMPHPNPGAVFDASAYTRVGNTINFTRFRQGKAVEVTQVVIVPGKTLTFTGEGITAGGQPYHSVVVYDRQ